MFSRLIVFPQNIGLLSILICRAMTVGACSEEEPDITLTPPPFQAKLFIRDRHYLAYTGNKQ
jgi:hypothetical protein